MTSASAQACGASRTMPSGPLRRITSRATVCTSSAGVGSRSARTAAVITARSCTLVCPASAATRSFLLLK
ncbi:Uncharacterised protein [Mycobacteroides abscessus subsp. abscessus]|nr:Uncharacterised protein [Mycobacteroides abscessus subsp. abscessus]